MNLLTYGTRQDDYLEISNSTRVDLVFGLAGDDFLFEGADPENISSDILVGGRGRDRIVSRGGADILLSGAGDDIVQLFGSAAVIARGGKGHDVLFIHDPKSGPVQDINAPFELPESPAHVFRGFEEVHYI